MIDELDTHATKKVQKRWKKLQNKPIKKKDENDKDIAEAYSPPRMVEAAMRLGYKPGFAIDLTKKNKDGKPWDLSIPERQEEALSLLDEMAPWVLIMSPPCTMFSTLQGFNFKRQDEADVEPRMKAAIEHLAFCVLLCRRQAAAGRKFVFEHPAGASSWQLNLIKKLYQIENTAKVNFDFCQAGMKLKKTGEHVKKRTGIMTNSVRLQGVLRGLQCPGHHSHAAIFGQDARDCQEYPDEFCDLVCSTLMIEKNEVNGILGEIRQAEDITGEINALLDSPHMEEDEAQGIYDEFLFFDDLTGKELERNLAIEARKLEMAFFRKMKVYKKVPRWKAQNANCKVITTKWIDVNKGDNTNPNYRARLVGRELKLDNRLDLFSATPPLESLKTICSICASNQSRADPYKILSIDVKRAYFYARAARPVFIEIPIEDYEPGDEHNVGELCLSLYGTRDAAQNWAKEFTTTLEDLGFITGKASPCNFYQPEKSISMTVHGDDFTATGPETALEWLKQSMEVKYEIKSETLGPEKYMSQEIRVLNRILRWGDHGVEYEPDQRHAEMIIQDMQVAGGKSVNTPIMNEDKNSVEERMKTNELSKADATAYRGLAARLNYLALDRVDLQFTAKVIAKHMSSPREYDWAAVKRVARYLLGVPRAIQHFHWQGQPEQIVTFTDSDWAGDRQDRKSTSGGAVTVGSHMLKSWSSTQQIVALSSGEAELYAILKGAAQTKGMMAMFMDFGMQVSGIVKSDASAAIGMVHRQGLGKVRHIEVQYLWIQQEVRHNKLQVHKVGTHENPADVLTKGLKAETMEKHVKSLHVELRQTRADMAPRLQEVSGGTADRWLTQSPAAWTRQHNKPRRAMFTPMRVAGSPQNGGCVGSVRITIGRYANGERFEIVDDWKTADEPHMMLRKPWTGVTTFVN